MSYNFQAFDVLIECLSPQESSRKLRRDILQLIRNLVVKDMNSAFLCSTGSFSSSTYLPESDIDLVLLAPPNTDGMEYILQMINSLCRYSGAENCSLEDFSNRNSHSIRNVEFINAKTKLLHCVVDNVSVDITVNQIGAALAVLMLEEVDELIGHHHLFKRSLLLIKTWCYHETLKYSGVAILGSKYGYLSSYCLAVMLLHIFDTYFMASLQAGERVHPFSVFCKFLCVYSQLLWSSHVVTVSDGIVPIQFGNSAGGTHSFGAKSGRYFENIIRKYRIMRENSPFTVPSTTSFPIRLCNVQDPIDIQNNLCISVTSHGIQMIDQALKAGYHHLRNIAAHSSMYMSKNRRYVVKQLKKQTYQMQNQDTAGLDSYDNGYTMGSVPASEERCSKPRSMSEFSVNSDSESSDCVEKINGFAQQRAGMSVSVFPTITESNSPARVPIPGVMVGMDTDLFPTDTGPGVHILEAMFPRSCNIYMPAFFQVPDVKRQQSFGIYVQKLLFSRNNMKQEAFYPRLLGPQDEVSFTLECLQSPSLLKILEAPKVDTDRDATKSPCIATDSLNGSMSASEEAESETESDDAFSLMDQEEADSVDNDEETVENVLGNEEITAPAVVEEGVLDGLSESNVIASEHVVGVDEEERDLYLAPENLPETTPGNIPDVFSVPHIAITSPTVPVVQSGQVSPANKPRITNSAAISPTNAVTNPQQVATPCIEVKQSSASPSPSRKKDYSAKTSEPAPSTAVEQAVDFIYTSLSNISILSVNGPVVTKNRRRSASSDRVDEERRSKSRKIVGFSVILVVVLSCIYFYRYAYSSGSREINYHADYFKSIRDFKDPKLGLSAVDAKAECFGIGKCKSSLKEVKSAPSETDNSSFANTAVSALVNDSSDNQDEIDTFPAVTRVTVFVKAGESLALSVALDDARVQKSLKRLNKLPLYGRKPSKDDVHSSLQRLYDANPRESERSNALSLDFLAQFLFVWRHEGEVVLVHDELSIDQHIAFPMQHIDPTHQGEYSCYAILRTTSSTDRFLMDDQSIVNFDKNAVLLAQIMVEVVAPPTCVTKSMYISIRVHDDLIIPLDCTGAPALTYQWFRNGIAVVSQTGAAYFEKNAKENSGGTYSCEVRNIAGAITWLEATVSVLK